ncbi:signal peptidase I [Bacillus mexicanus]|uniref:signal peptidase I SipW n=1 Tax=Bacillus mexicanus TaxID=2834415 RepID=UPI003D1BDAEC
MRLINNILYVVILTLIIVLTLVVISTRSSGGEPAIFGYTLKSVMSGSMEPEFNTGSLILVKEITDVKELQKGDVITFMQNANTAVTHRIIDMTKQGDHLLFKTKGDNNAAADSALVPDENVRAQYTGFQLPYAGYMLYFASQPIGTAVLLIVPGVMLLVYAFVTISNAIREVERKTKALETEEKDSTVST